jgi:hypothetical protein
MKQVFLPVFKIGDCVYGTKALRPLDLKLNQGCVVSNISDVSVLIVPEPMVDGIDHLIELCLIEGNKIVDHIRPR